MITTILLFFQNSTGTLPSVLPWVSTVVWILAGIAAIGYLISGYVTNVSSGRKDLLEVNEQKLKHLEKDLEKASLTIEQLEEKLQKAKADTDEVLKDKIILMREHHQLLELSSNDLKRLQIALKKLKAMETELNIYREERGLARYDESHIDLDDE